MKKNLLIICSILLIGISFISTPVMVNAETADRNAEEKDYVGNMTCGGTADEGRGITFHKSLPEFTSRLYDFLKIATPVVIIITGMLDILKAVTAQKEDDIKKSQKKLINRLMMGTVVFLVFVIVEVVVGFVAEGDAKNAMDCVDCFLNNKNCVTVTNSAFKD